MTSLHKKKTFRDCPDPILGMMLNVFIIVAVLVVVKGDTLVENFYVKLKDLRNPAPR